MKIGIALRQMEEGNLRQHLLMNSSRLTTWKTFKSEIVDIKRAAAAVGAVPIDIGAFAKGRGKGGKGDVGKCGHCGKAGHSKKDCWALGGGDSLVAADAGKGKGKSKGKTKGGTSSGKQATGRPDHAGTAGSQATWRRTASRRR